MPPQNNLRSIFFYILLAGVGALTLFMFLPYIITLAMATACAVVCQPLYRALLRMVNGREFLAALLTIGITGIVVLAPVMLIGMQVVYEATAMYEKINTTQPFGNNVLGTLEQTVEEYIRPYVPSFDIDLGSVARQSLTWFSTRIGTVFANALQTILHFFLGVIAFYYFLKDGDTFIERIIELSPLKDTHDRSIFQRLVVAINSILKGSLLIAIIQGLSSGIGFALFGVPSATLWGGLAALGALVPGVGTAIVIAPAVLYLFITDQSTAAIGLSIWGVIAVGMIDNFLGPILMGRGARIHPLFILFAVIGGLELFGAVGFILGPLVLSLLFALLDIYSAMTKRTTNG